MVAVDPQDPENKIFAATDFGFYFTIDGGKNWTKDTRIPNVEIHEIKMRNSDRRLFLFTHGRGSWTIKLSPLSNTKNIVKQNQMLNVYPNPANDIIHVAMNNGEPIQSVEIYNFNGTRVLETKSLNIQSTNISSGIYFIRVKTNQNTYTKKIKISH
jgi:hypothetical protein